MTAPDPRLAVASQLVLYAGDPRWEKRDPRQLLARGGSLRAPGRGREQRVHVTFREVPTWQIDEQPLLREPRAQVLLAIVGLGPLAIKPHRDARPREMDPAHLEQCGARALRDRELAGDPWTVRIYYPSAAGEVLAADFGGLTEDHARALAAEYARLIPSGRDNPARGIGIDAECWRERRPLVTCTKARGGGDCRKDDGDLLPKAQRAACARCGGKGKVPDGVPPVRRGARVVTWPSELPRAYPDSIPFQVDTESGAA